MLVQIPRIVLIANMVQKKSPKKPHMNDNYFYL